MNFHQSRRTEKKQSPQRTTRFQLDQDGKGTLREEVKNVRYAMNATVNSRGYNGKVYGKKGCVCVCVAGMGGGSAVEMDLRD